MATELSWEGGNSVGKMSEGRIKAGWDGGRLGSISRGGLAIKESRTSHCLGGPRRVRPGLTNGVTNTLDLGARHCGGRHCRGHYCGKVGEKTRAVCGEKEERKNEEGMERSLNKRNHSS